MPDPAALWVGDSAAVGISGCSAGLDFIAAGVWTSRCYQTPRMDCDSAELGVGRK